MRLLCAALLLLSTRPALAEPTSVLVLPIEARAGVATSLAEAVTAALVGELRRVPHLKVSSIREVESAMTQEQRRQLAGCDTASCAVEIGGALNVDEIVIGTLSRVANEFLLSVSRVASRDGQSRGSAYRRVAADKEAMLLDVVPSLVGGVAGVRLPPVRVAGKTAGNVVPASLVTPAPRAPTRIAVIYFDNTSKLESLEPLRKGLADMFITDFSQCQAVQVVEREKLQALLDELKLQRTEAFDLATAQKLGRMLGVQYLLMGDYLDLLGQFRIGARLVNVSTGAIVLSYDARGKKEDFMALQSSVTMKMLAALEAPLAPAEEQEIRNDDGKLEDAVEYAQALDAYDRGDRASATVRARAVAQRVPLFKPARALLARLEAMAQ